MSGIKYYRLAENEETPDEFCAIRDRDGEPSDYIFYVPDPDNEKLHKANEELLIDVKLMECRLRACAEERDELKAENVKLRAKVKRQASDLTALRKAEVLTYKGQALENAKLRELTHIFLKHCSSGSCDECPMHSNDGTCRSAEIALKMGIGVAK